MVFALLLVQGVARAEEAKAFTAEQLEQLVAPIALYPDSLVAQILMAATYPLELVEADRWRQQNIKLSDQELETAVEEKPWDPSVVSLTYFPDVLHRLSENLDWTQDLGDAMLAQQAEVMDAVQRMRKYAKEAGNLQTTEQQTVIVEKEVIRIEPVTEVIYVPTYNPTVIYGSYWYVPRYYYPIYSYPPGYWASNMISFGIGVAIGSAIWGGCNWHHHDIDININHNHWRRSDININRDGKWKHNPSHRQNVRYRDNQTRDRFAGADRSARDRGDRGFDRKPADSGALQRDLKAAADRPGGKRDISSANKGKLDLDLKGSDMKSMARDNKARDSKARDSKARAGGPSDRAAAGGRDLGGDRSKASRTGGLSSERSSKASRSAFSGDRSSGRGVSQASNRGATSRSGGFSGARGGGGGRAGGGGRGR